MLYRVIKGAFGPGLLAEVERRARPIETMAAATVEHDEAATRRAELRWFMNGTPEYAWIEGEIFGLLAREEVTDPRLCVLEDVQYTEYGPGGFHDWHIDAYRRPYNAYDLPLGKKFIGKKRKLSMSVLLNDADEYEGGRFEISMFPNGKKTMGTAIEGLSAAGDAVIFDAALCHRVAPVTKGLRKSLVAWICA